MFHQIFLSPQVKRCAIITYKNGIYELSQELSSDLRLTILEFRKYQESVETPENDSPVPTVAAKMVILLILAKNFTKVEIKLFPQCTISHEN